MKTAPLAVKDPRGRPKLVAPAWPVMIQDTGTTVQSHSATRLTATGHFIMAACRQIPMAVNAAAGFRALTDADRLGPQFAQPSVNAEARGTQPCGPANVTALMQCRSMTWGKPPMRRPCVYFMAGPASPGVLIGQLGARRHDVVPDAILTALSDWTGQDFGRRLPLAGTVRQWQSWWSVNREHYDAGRRYFHGYPVP